MPRRVTEFRFRGEEPPPPSIRVVPDEYGACPNCSAYWGHPDPELDFPNRCKVDDFWRCYNPNCNIGYYNPDTGETELALSPEEEQAAIERIRAEFANVTFEQTGPNTWKTVRND